MNYPFILIYLFKYKFQFFIFLERFVINLSYFFNKYFFIDLLKKYYLRNAISFFNFVLIVLILVPIYFFFYFFSYIFYFTRNIKFFFKDSIYWNYNVNRFENFYEDVFRNLLFEKLYEERYDYIIYWLNLLKYELFAYQYFRFDRESVHKKYLEILDKPRSVKDAPIEDVFFEYWNEKRKYSVGTSAAGTLKGYYFHFIINKLAGNYIKYKMYFHDHYFDDPIFFSMYVNYLDESLFPKKIISVNSILNFFKIKYLKSIIIKYQSFFIGFWYYYFFTMLYYPIYFFFYFLDLIHIIYLSLTFESYHVILCRLYLIFIIIKNYLFSFLLILKLTNFIKLIYNILKNNFIKLRLYLERDKVKLLSFEIWKKWVLFYFFFLKYKFILKVFRIFFIRLWIIVFSLVIIIFFFDDEELWAFCYEWKGAISLGEQEWEVIRFIFDPVYSFQYLFRDFILLNLMDKIKFDGINKCLFDWSIIHMDWIFYIKAWYRQYVPHVHWVFMPFRDLLVLLGLDSRWWIFQVKLWYQMDYVLYGWIICLQY